jgi:hypothetical protein
LQRYPAGAQGEVVLKYAAIVAPPKLALCQWWRGLLYYRHNIFLFLLVVVQSQVNYFRLPKRMITDMKSEGRSTSYNEIFLYINVQIIYYSYARRCGMV